jgi:hypothetical protein
VTAADVVSVALLAVLVRAMIADYRLDLPGDARLSLRSWPRIALWLAVLVALRQFAWREVPWHVRVGGWCAAAWRWEPLRAAVPPFITSRAAMLIVGFVAVRTIGFATTPEWRALTNDWLDLFARWDAGWYYEIASRGYPSHFNPQRMNAVAFFPGLPLAMHAAAYVLGLHLWGGGIAAVLMAFLAGLVYVYRLARLDMPADRARAALMFLAFYPFAVCYGAVLTESLFLLAAAAAFYHFRRGQLAWAAAFGLGVGLLRPNGFLLAVPLALLAVIPFAAGRGWLAPFQRRGAARTDPARDGAVRWSALAVQLLVAAAPAIGMLGYAAYIHSLTGNALAWMQAQAAWGRATAGGLDLLDARRDLVGLHGWGGYLRLYPVELLEAAAAFFALGAVWPIVRRFGLAYGVFVAMAVVPPLFTMGPVSLGRYTAPLFPIFLWLGASVPDTRRPYWIALFAAGQALVAALFYTWRPPY